MCKESFLSAFRIIVWILLIDTVCVSYWYTFHDEPLGKRCCEWNSSAASFQKVAAHCVVS